MNDINLGILEQGPHADLIRHMAVQCAADSSIQAVWVVGSLAAGLGDAYSDVDFRIGVKPRQIGDKWTNPDWDNYLPIRPVADYLMRWHQTAVHHMLLADGTLLDFTIHDSPVQNYEPKPIILACRNPQFRAALEGYPSPAHMPFSAIDGPQVKRFFVDYWITSYQQMKALARQHDESAFAGLYPERLALLRAWFMDWVGRDIKTLDSPRMLGALHHGLDGRLTDREQNLLGAPSRTPGETAAVLEAIRSEMSRVGRCLANRYGFAYPYELEEVVTRTWNERKACLMRR